MRTNAGVQTSWKQFFQDAVLECDPRAFQERLETARKAIEGRLLELGSHDDADRCELVELKYAQQTISVLRKSEST